MAELEDTLSHREMVEWMLFERMEGFGEFRANARAGIIASLLYNAHRKKGSRAAKPEDFMPDHFRVRRK